MKDLRRILLAGKFLLDPSEKVIKITMFEKRNVIRIPYANLKASDWGYVYERYVGMILEEEGYAIKFRGLAKGFLDNGIDIIAKKEGEDFFIQCKYIMKNKLGKQKIEWLLYKASSFLAKNYKGGKIHFWLVVPSIESAFNSKKDKNGMSYYPWAKYFLSKNYEQSKVILKIKEIEMIR